MEQSRQGCLQRLKQAIQQANTYLKKQRKAKVSTQQTKIGAMLKSLKLHGWTALEIQERTLALNTDDQALKDESKLDGCKVLEHIVPQPDELPQKLLAALNLELPKHIPVSKRVVGTRVNLQNPRKTIDK
jgi:hypothetical protein